MKSKPILFICLLVLFSCSQKPAIDNKSVIHKMIDTLSVSRSENMVIFTVNPNDCISCLNGFRHFEETLSLENRAIIYVIAVGRSIEREALQKELSHLQFNNGKNKAIVWSRQLFDSINRFAHINSPVTSVSVYNYENDTLLFSKPVRELEDVEIVRKQLQWKPGAAK